MQKTEGLWVRVVRNWPLLPPKAEGLDMIIYAGRHTDPGTKYEAEKRLEDLQASSSFACYGS